MILYILGKHTQLEKQLINPTLIGNKILFNDLRKSSNINNILFILHGLNLCLLEILHTAYLFYTKVDIIEFATMEETITSTIEVRWSFSLEKLPNNKCRVYNFKS